MKALGKKPVLFVLAFAIVLPYLQAQRPIPPHVASASPGDIGEGVVEREEAGELRLNTASEPCIDNSHITVFRDPYCKQKLKQECRKEYAHVEQCSTNDSPCNKKCPR